MPTPESGEHWGILGGLFDPVHRGHLNLADEAFRNLDLKGIIFVPSFIPPHRQNSIGASFEDRVAMLHLGLEDRPWATISRIEETLAGPNFTLHTVRALSKEHPNSKLSLIVGADHLASFTSWHDWETLLEEVTLIVGQRPGAAVTKPDMLHDRSIEVIDNSRVKLSSTHVRENLKAGVSIELLRHWLPLSVITYIMEKGLYR